ncbi:putative nuclease HARBI1 [Clytia hemisphaerica]|uniref:putative nuclease HARBI1 n=1 Tax=Clytia hemisphaerica TaxID=252671 RepID=UPI0034D55275
MAALQRQFLQRWGALLFGNDKIAIVHFLQGQGLLSIVKACPGCNSNMRLERHNQCCDGYRWMLFRMGRSTFEKLLLQIGTDPVFIQNNPGGQPMTPTEDQIMLFLWYCATQDDFMRVGDRFCVASSTAIDCVDRVSKAIINVIYPEYVKWPTFRRAKRIMSSFSKRGLPKIVGAIDGTHIRISPPSEKPEQYVNRKGFHSLNFQATCDNNLLFTDVYGGWPGSVLDARVYKNSDLAKRIARHPINTCHGGYLIGDAAYSLSFTLITPYKNYGNFNAIQKRFNYVQSSSRVAIERAFGLLKEKFHRLKNFEMVRLDRLTTIVHALCAIHNFLIVNETIEYNDRRERVDIDEDLNDETITSEVASSSAKEVSRKRDRIARTLYSKRNNHH